MRVEAQSKKAASDSIQVAHTEMKRLSGLDERAQYDRFVCEFWYYESITGRSNFAKLTDAERKELEKVVKDQAFFLHRFTSKEKRAVTYEIFVSEDGAAVIGSRSKAVEKQER